MGNINLNPRNDREPSISVTNPSDYALALNKAPESDATSVERIDSSSWYDGRLIVGLSFTPETNPALSHILIDPNLKPTIRNTFPAGSQRPLALLCRDRNSTLWTLYSIKSCVLK